MGYFTGALLAVSHSYPVFISVSLAYPAAVQNCGFHPGSDFQNLDRHCIVSVSDT